MLLRIRHIRILIQDHDQMLLHNGMVIWHVSFNIRSKRAIFRREHDEKSHT